MAGLRRRPEVVDFTIGVFFARRGRDTDRSSSGVAELIILRPNLRVPDGIQSDLRAMDQAAARILKILGKREVMNDR